MSDYPKDGSTFVTETILRTAYRWTKYKPDGARQMGKPGRWQKQVWSGDYFKWENCEDPEGEISQPIVDGPISRAFKDHASLLQRIKGLEGENERLKSFVKSFRFTVTDSFYKDAYLQLIEPDSVHFRLGNGSQFAGFISKLEERRAALEGSSNG